MRLVGRLKTLVRVLRQRSPFVDHAVFAWQRADAVLWSRLAASITYFGFLSLFPLVVIAVSVLGLVIGSSEVAEREVREAVELYLPGLIGTGENQLNLEDLQDQAGGTTVLGVLALLWTGTGFIDALRDALRVIFGTAHERHALPVNKLRSLFVLLVVGTLILATVTLSSTATAATEAVLQLLDAEGEAARLVLRLLAIGLALTLNTLVLTFVFRFMSAREPRWRDVLGGALLGGIGIEILKLFATSLLSQVRGNPLYGALALAFGLLVWINLTSRIIVLAAAWAATSPPLRERTLAAGFPGAAEQPAGPAPERQGGVAPPPRPVRSLARPVVLAAALRRLLRRRGEGGRPAGEPQQRDVRR